MHQQCHNDNDDGCVCAIADCTLTRKRTLRAGGHSDDACNCAPGDDDATSLMAQQHQRPHDDYNARDCLPGRIASLTIAHCAIDNTTTPPHVQPETPATMSTTTTQHHQRHQSPSSSQHPYHDDDSTSFNDHPTLQGRRSVIDDTAPSRTLRRQWCDDMHHPMAEDAATSMRRGRHHDHDAMGGTWHDARSLTAPRHQWHHNVVVVVCMAACLMATAPEHDGPVLLIIS